VHPDLVFIHGIGRPRDAEKELSDWLAALDDKHSVDALVRRGDVKATFVSYGDLFVDEDEQGAADVDLTGPEAEMVTAMLAEMIDAKLAPEHGDAEDDRTRSILQHARAQLQPSDDSQGVLGPVNTLLNVSTTLLSIPPLRRAGEWVTARMMVHDLSQVARYLSRGEPDESGFSLGARIRSRFLDAIGFGKTVVVAHSLGSVVAFEALHQRECDISLFVTIGSPLGLRTAVWPHLRPVPPRTPEGVARWLNFWDPDDIVAVSPRIERRLIANSRDVLPGSARVESDGLWVHNATTYLARPEIAGPIARALNRRHGMR
jgi:pimeloyl-ACP methyl ester carboxylesterase